MRTENVHWRIENGSKLDSMATECQPIFIFLFSSIYSATIVKLIEISEREKKFSDNQNQYQAFNIVQIDLKVLDPQ